VPLFVFIGHDGPDGSERRKLHRERHVAHLEALDRAGRLVYGGPISPLKKTALMLRQAQHERENACGARLSAHPEPVEGRAESLFQRAVIRDESDRSIGALIILDAPDLAAARAIVDQDPYVTGSVSEHIELNRFVRAFPR
jgi:uncharacterized protein YciI